MPALALAALAAIARMQQGSWMAPGAFFALTWSIMVWIPILVLRDVPPYAPAVAWIAATAAVLLIGSHFGSLGRAGSGASARRAWPFLNLLLVVCAAGGLVTLGLLLHSKGAGPAALLSIHQLQELGSGFSTDRYRHLPDPTGPKYLIILVYLGGLLSGLRLATARGPKDLAAAVAPLVPALLISVLEATRAAILFPLVLMVSSYLATRVPLSGGRDRLFSWRRVLLLGGAAAGLLVVSLAVLALRYESVETHANLLNLLGRVRLDSFGYLAVWSVWFSQGGWTATGHPALGYYTFGGLFDLLHLRARVPGVYADPVSFGGPHGTSNIFTIFRGTIQDFTAAGSMVAFLVLGAIAGRGYRSARAGHAPAAPILTAFYAITIWSFVVDIFSYNTILAGWLLYAGYVWFAPRVERAWMRDPAPEASVVGAASR